MQTLIREIYQDVIEGRNREVERNVRASLESGENPVDVLNEGMIAAMAEVGRRFEEGEFFVPEMLVAARAMQAGMAVLKPFLGRSEVSSTGRVVIGTVKGDLHDIGKNLVAMMLEGAGFEIQDLGTDVAPDKFVEAVRASAGYKQLIVAMSALLTTTMTSMKATLTALENAGLRKHVKVIVGGAPVTDDYAKGIGADGYAPDASRAVSLVKSLIAH